MKHLQLAVLLFAVLLVLLVGSRASLSVGQEQGPNLGFPQLTCVDQKTLGILAWDFVRLRNVDEFLIAGYDPQHRGEERWVSNSAAGKLQLWSRDPLAKKLTLHVEARDNFGALFNADISQNGKTIATVGLLWKKKGKRVVRIWDVESDKTQVVPGIDRPTTVAIDQSRNRILIGLESGDAVIWDYEKNAQVAKFKKVAKHLVHQVSYSPDFKLFAIVPWSDGPIRVFSAESLSEVAAIEVDGAPGAMAFSPNSKLLCVSWENEELEEGPSSIEVYQTDSWKKKGTLEVDAFISQIAFNENGTLMGSTGIDPFVRIWNPESLELICRTEMNGGRSSVESIALFGGADPAILTTTRAELDVIQFELPLSFAERKVIASVEEFKAVVWLGLVNKAIHATHVDLSDSNATDRACNKLRLLKHLKELDLSGTQVSDSTIKSLGVLNGLEKLNVKRTGVSIEAIDFLKTKIPGIAISR